MRRSSAQELLSGRTTGQPRIKRFRTSTSTLQAPSRVAERTSVMSESSQLLKRMLSAGPYRVRFRHDRQLAAALYGELDCSRTLLVGGADARW